MSEHALEHGKAIPSLVPARMDRLPWTRFHWMIVVGLGVSWILDGLEIQLVSLVGNVLKEPETLHLTTSEVGLMASVYLAGEVVGALLFGRLTDRLGRRSLFIVTLLVYLIASGAAGLSWNLGSLLFFRFVAGMGIGGEYAAINSAIDELIPSRYRGRVDIGVNGTYWAGALIGSAVGLVFLNTDIVPIEWGWRLCFLIGPVMGLVIIYLRRHIPESPRWLMTHGRVEEAERDHEELLAAVAVGELAEQERARARARDVEGRREADVGAAHRDAAAGLREARRDGADDRHLEAVEDPDGPEPDHDAPVESGPRQAVDAAGDLRRDRPATPPRPRADGARRRGHGAHRCGSRGLG